MFTAGPKKKRKEPLYIVQKNAIALDPDDRNQNTTPLTRRYYVTSDRSVEETDREAAPFPR